MSEEPIERIRISEIHIGNPRPRNRARWQMIVANIREVGLKNQSPWFAEQLQVLTGKYSISSVARDELRPLLRWKRPISRRSSLKLDGKISS